MGNGCADRQQGQEPATVSRRVVLPSLAAVAGLLGSDAASAQGTDDAGGKQRRPEDAGRRRAASLRVDEWPVIPGALVKVAGSGFPPDRRGAIFWESAASGPVRLATARSNGRGKVAAEVRLPVEANVDGRIVARIGGKSAEAPVDVEIPQGKVALGAFERSKGQEAPWSAAALDRLRAAMGRNPGIVHWFQAWGADGDGMRFQRELLDRVASRGAVPLVTWEPWVPGGSTKQPAYQLSEIVEGKFDGYIREWAVAFKDWGEDSGQPALLRFAHEMNGAWYPWAAGVNGNSAEDYRNAWRHVRDIFRSVGATNVGWVWCPNVEFDGSTPLEGLYPGDADVDWVGVDGYNWGKGAPQGQGWQTFLNVFDDTLTVLQNLAPGKPLMIAETGCSPDGGNKGQWLRRALFNELPLQFPEIDALVWFNATKEERWRFDTDPSSLRAFRAAAANPFYAGPLEGVANLRASEGRRRMDDDQDRDRRQRRRNGSDRRGRKRQ